MAIFIPRFVRQLRDVLLTSPADGEVLTYDSADEKWKNEAGGGGGGPPTGAAGGVLGGTYPNPGFDVDMATQAELDAHVTDITDAHDATAVSVAPFGTIAATQVQAALEEIVAEAVSDLGPAVILAPASSARNVIQPTAGDVIAAIVKAHAAQSVDLTQWQLSDGTPLFQIGATGKVSLTRSSIPADVDDFALSLVSQSVPGAFDPNLAYWLHQIAGRPGVDNDLNYENSVGGNSADLASWTTVGYGTSAGGLILNRRRTSDDAITARSVFSPDGFYSERLNPDTAIYSDFVSLDSGYYGYYAAGPLAGKLLIGAGFVDYEATVKIIETNPAGGVARIGFFAATPVVQQAASSLAALWTGLKNYGWLTAGSTVPAVYEPGGTDVAVADGGTGASTAAGARTNLGLVIGTDVPGQAAFDDHNVRHENGGADAIKLDDFATPDDNTDLDASVTRHGLLPKLSGDDTEFLDGDGNWTTPAGGGADDQTAAEVPFTPAGTIAATDVQAAIEEVASEGGGGGIAATLFDANTILKADTDDTPVALTMDASTMLARLASGSIKAASVAEIKSLLGITASYSPDRPPASPSATDDEFNDSSLDGAWTSDGSPDTLSETALNGFLKIEDNDGATCGAYRSYAPGANTLTVAFKVHYDLTLTANGLAGVDLADSSGTRLAVATLQNNAANAIRLRTGPTGSTNVVMGTMTLTPLVGHYYVAIRRDATTNYTIHVSTDGITWWQGASFSQAGTIARAYLIVNGQSSQNATAYFDFVRFFTSQTAVIGS